MANEGYVPPKEHTDSNNGEEYASQGIPMTEEGVDQKKDFVPSKGLTTFEAQQLLQKWGRNELEDKKKSKVSKIYPFVNIFRENNNWIWIF